ncbi:MAG TPA: ATP-binding protein [Polyangiaceae bacterium]
MNDQDQAKEKVILLMQRERELFAMRMKHEQVTQWLKLTQSLAPLFDLERSVVEIYGRLRKALIAGLRLQRVLFLEFGTESLRSLAPVGPDRAAGSDVFSFLELTPSGFCNEPNEPNLRALADLVGLHQFFWSVIRVATAPPVLLAAGFDPDKAAFQTPFDASAAAQIDNTAQHISSMLENHSLARRLKAEKEGLELANLSLRRRDEELEAVGQQLRSVNEHLEQRVSERTAELAHRNRDLHLVLDNVNQAFLTIDREGQLSREHSAIVDRWFGPYSDRARFCDYIAAASPAFADNFALAYEALLEGFLPLEVCLSQIPSRLSCADSEYSCSYFLLQENERVSGLVIVISDVTEQVLRSRAEAEHAEVLALFQCFTRDRAGYLTFVNEADQIVKQLVEDALDSPTQKRLLHTLKGNAASIMGDRLIASLCHTAEDQLSGDAEGSVAATIAAIASRWSAIMSAMGWGGDQPESLTVEVTLEQIAQASEEVRLGRSSAALARLALWQSEPALQPLTRLAKGAEELARRLGKGNLNVALSAPDVRLDFQKWSGVWASLVHVVRNAVDHGLELPEERRSASKPESSMLDLRMRVNGRRVVVEIEDDGRGIDWDRIRILAVQRGLAHDSQDDLLRALFASGLSTKREVTSTSGRGVGMSAVLEQIRTLGGEIHVSSRLHQGTCWSISLPISEGLPIYASGPALGSSRCDAPSPADN